MEDDKEENIEFDMITEEEATLRELILRLNRETKLFFLTRVGELPSWVSSFFSESSRDSRESQLIGFPKSSSNGRLLPLRARVR